MTRICANAADDRMFARRVLLSPWAHECSDQLANSADMALYLELDAGHLLPPTNTGTSRDATLGPSAELLRSSKHYKRVQVLHGSVSDLSLSAHSREASLTQDGSCGSGAKLLDWLTALHAAVLAAARSQHSSHH